MFIIAENKVQSKKHAEKKPIKVITVEFPKISLFQLFFLKKHKKNYGKCHHLKNLKVFWHYNVR